MSIADGVKYCILHPWELDGVKHYEYFYGVLCGKSAERARWFDSAEEVKLFVSKLDPRKNWIIASVSHEDYLKCFSNQFSLKESIRLYKDNYKFNFRDIVHEVSFYRNSLERRRVEILTSIEEHTPATRAAVESIIAKQSVIEELWEALKEVDSCHAVTV